MMVREDYPKGVKQSCLCFLSSFLQTELGNSQTTPRGVCHSTARPPGCVMQCSALKKKNQNLFFPSAKDGTQGTVSWVSAPSITGQACHISHHAQRLVSNGGEHERHRGQRENRCGCFYRLNFPKTGVNPTLALPSRIVWLLEGGLGLELKQDTTMVQNEEAQAQHVRGGE